MNKKLARSGAVSMLTVIMLSIFLSLITTGFVRLMVSYQRESTNNDLSNRAYYAAQSGFEDALRLLKDNKVADSKATCPPLEEDGTTAVSSISVATAVSGVDAAYTCELITLPSSLTSLTYGDGVGGVPANQAVFFPIDPGKAPSDADDNINLSIAWTPGDNVTDHGKALPSKSEWGDAPAMMRVNLVWTDSADSLSTTKSSAFYLNPSRSADSPAPAVDLGSGGLPEEPIVNVACSPSDGCHGTIELNNYSSDMHLFVIVRPIYKSANSVSVALSDTADTSLGFKSGQATIDITGRAGNTYRRIKRNIPYTGDSSYTVTPLGGDMSDFALVAGNGICKQLSVGRATTSYFNGCTPP